MLDVMCHLRIRLGHPERGASLVEYTLLVALIALVCFGALMFLGTATSGDLDRSSSCITAAQKGEALPENCP